MHHGDGQRYASSHVQRRPEADICVTCCAAVGPALMPPRTSTFCSVDADTKQRIRDQTRAAMQRPDVQAKLRRSHPPHSEETKVCNDLLPLKLASCIC